MNFLKNLIKKFKKWHHLKKCGYYRLCPKCDDVLKNWEPIDEDGYGYFNCKCGEKSRWLFNFPPYPILIPNDFKSIHKRFDEYDNQIKDNK